MSTVYELGPFRLDPAAGVLSYGGRPLALGSRAVAVLTALVRRPNEYVRKESILDEAWAGVVVEESNLAVQISAIRRALGQTPGGERWVETLARRGYRFIGPVAELSDDRQPNARGNSKEPEPSRAADIVHRPRARAGGDQATVAEHPPVDARWCRRHRRDPARVAGGRRSCGCLPRRSLVGGVWIDQRSTAGADVCCAGARGSGKAGHAAHGHAVCLSQSAAGIAHPGQLRAPC